MLTIDVGTNADNITYKMTAVKAQQIESIINIRASSKKCAKRFQVVLSIKV